MNNKVLSIGIAAYNMERYIRRCLDSLLISNLDDIEIIVSNNGSTDSTKEIVDEYVGKYPNSIKQIIIPINGHYGRAVNNSIAAATGKYFRLLDSDDEYLTDNLEDFVSWLKYRDEDIIFSQYITESKNSSIIRPSSLNNDLIGQTLLVDDLNWSSDTLKFFRAMHSMAVKTELFKRHNYYQTEGIGYSDTQYVFFADLYARNCTFFDKPVYRYYLGVDGQTVSMQAMIKNNSHFYENAICLLKDYVKLPATVSLYRNNLLESSIDVLISYYISATIGITKDNSKYLPFFDNLLQLIRSSRLPNNIEKNMERNAYYALKFKYHLPDIFIFYIRKFKNIFNRFCSHF